jgi:hypothetical protein
MLEISRVIPGISACTHLHVHTVHTGYNCITEVIQYKEFLSFQTHTSVLDSPSTRLQQPAVCCASPAESLSSQCRAVRLKV